MLPCFPEIDNVVSCTDSEKTRLKLVLVQWCGTFCKRPFYADKQALVIYRYIYVV